MDPNLQYSGASVIPSELSGQLPRRTRITSDVVTTAVMAMIFLALALAGICWLSINAIQKIQIREALRSDSSETDGEIVRTGRSYVYYRFAVNGMSFTGEAHVPEQQWTGVMESGSLPIRYLPANPAVNHPSAWEESTISVWLIVIFPDLVLFILAALGIMLFLQLRTGRRMVAEGTPAVAVITKCTPAKGRSGIGIEYEFRTEDGRVINGRSGFVSLQEIGASICILYLATNPLQNQPYELLNFRAEQ
jgi:hypothetical protein